MIFLTGKYCQMRLANISDSEFILSLRQNEKKSKFLNQSHITVQEQMKWMSLYKEREVNGIEYYFIITDLNLTPVGTYRLYNIESSHATPGSWIIKDNTDFKTTFESVLLMYDFVFNELNKLYILFDVRQGNKKVKRFHESYGSMKISEDSQDVYYKFIKDDFLKMKSKFSKYIG
ncbi:GNAT family N-acetyltransferase [Shewanella sp. SM32]|uniref:GNAT family N-acetyltransferase n=1 Tax=Shewanella TaxID=22 RepID=UPI0021D85563|nr:GNAT family N-acetyltransferase [Shewanella sp. SM32]MCU8069527.1 GNAT family N-acetyltransferase [Shewanella sp. SM32]